MKMERNIHHDYIKHFEYNKNMDEDLVLLQNCVEIDNEYTNEWLGLINEMNKKQKEQEKNIKSEITKVRSEITTMKHELMQFID